MTEIWKTVPYDSNYEVSDLGRVRSVDRVVPRKSSSMRLNGRILKPWAGSSGYLQVYLSNRRVMMVHHLVLDTFVGDRPEGLEGRHKNGKMHDNRSSNLDWSTHSVNIRNREVHGTDWQRSKTHCPRKHPLKEPNLVASNLRSGYRLCLACNRETSNSIYQGREFSSLQADENYQMILRGEKRPVGRRGHG